jgi:hypothetical protein
MIEGVGPETSKDALQHKDDPVLQALLAEAVEAQRLIDEGARGWEILEKLDGQIQAAGYLPEQVVTMAYELLYPATA